MENSEDARDNTLVEQNSRLQQLIDAIAQINAASCELLARLQHKFKATPPDTTNEE